MSTDLGIEIDKSVLVGFIEESRETLSGLDSQFIALEKDSTNADIINAIFRPVHSIKGNAPFFGLMRLKTLAHEFESVLAALRNQKIIGDKALFDLLLKGVDEIKAILERVAAGKPEVADESYFNGLIEAAKTVLSGNANSSNPTNIISQFKSIIDNFELASLSVSQLEQINKLKKLLSSQAHPAGSVPQPTTKEPEQPKSSAAESKANSAKTEVSKTMRIPEERIDTFLKFVGELVVAQDMLRHFASRAESQQLEPSLLKDLNTINGMISTLGTGLERAIMSIRKVPIKSLLQKAPRLIRDIATAKQKEIEVVIKGDEVEIDKSLIEVLDAPITHMARNAADHGIEMPAKREAAGKPRKGTVTISCEELERDILITISDDGGGLNYDGLTKKALSLGMLQPGEALNEARVISLIFMAGVSTAQEVSDISGRGVGMDVVKRNIESAGGAISVSSVAGKGCKFSIRLPKSVTTQIMQGFVFLSAGINFVVPLEKVHESWKSDKQRVTNIVSRGPCIQRQDAIMRLVDLAEFLGEVSQNKDNDERQIITIDIENQKLALCVDEIIGPRQLLVKPLEDLANREKCFMGGALLGNGEVALVLDVNSLIN